MRIAFPLLRSSAWTGGYNYLQNLFRVITSSSGDRVVPVLFAGDDVEEAELKPFVDGEYEVVCSPLMRDDQRKRSLFAALSTGRDAAAEKLFSQKQIDVVFEVAHYYGARFKIPALAWMPDFQHRHLPDMFSSIAWVKRDLGFRAQVKGGRIIMLSSEDARKDCEQFYPAARGRTCVVPFAVRIDSGMMTQKPERVRQQYGLPHDYYLLPNQYWQHKNHRLIIEALSYIPEKNIVIAATGNPSNPRHRELYRELREMVADRDLGDVFRFLGLVPYQDLIALMRSSRAIINPSLFEGWSTTVEEARALGVPLLLSDLGVHREQMGKDALYFPANSPEQCATLLRTFAAQPFQTAVQREHNAAVIMKNRELMFAQRFEQAVNKTVSSKKRRSF